MDEKTGSDGGWIQNPAEKADPSLLNLLMTDFQTESVGNRSKCGKCGSAPTWKTSGERGWRAGPTSMDKFSSGKSGLHCTQTAMRLALAKNSLTLN